MREALPSASSSRALSFSQPSVLTVSRIAQRAPAAGTSSRGAISSTAIHSCPRCVRYNLPTSAPTVSSGMPLRAALIRLVYASERMATLRPAAGRPFRSSRELVLPEFDIQFTTLPFRSRSRSYLDPYPYLDPSQHASVTVSSQSRYRSRVLRRLRSIYLLQPVGHQD